MSPLIKQKLKVLAAGVAVGLVAVWSGKVGIPNYNGPVDYPITKNVNYLNDTNDLDIRLFQYQSCPFCCKVRTYLDYHKMSYKIIEVNSVTRKQLEWSDYRKVPIVYINNNDTSIQVNDSSKIISFLESKRLNKKYSLEQLNGLYPEFTQTDEKGKTKTNYHNKYKIFLDNRPITDKIAEEEAKWRQWVDDVFVHTLSPNIYRTMSEAIEAFTYVSRIAKWRDMFGYFQTEVIIYIGAFAMYFVGKMLKKRHNLHDDVRQSLFEQGAIWTDALGSRKFLGGNKPNLGDLAMYGAIISIRGCSAYSELMKANPALKSWYRLMNQKLYRTNNALHA